VETIIRELPLPIEEKTIRPLPDGKGFCGGGKFIHNGLFLKIAVVCPAFFLPQ
jgi:hypothetical protein